MLSMIFFVVSLFDKKLGVAYKHNGSGNELLSFPCFGKTKCGVGFRHSSLNVLNLNAKWKVEDRVS